MHLKLSSRKNSSRWPGVMVLATTLIITACGGSSDDDEPDEGSAQYPSAAVDTGPASLIVTGTDSSNPDELSSWLVNLRQFRFSDRLDSTGDGTVNLVEYEGGGIPVTDFIEFYQRDLDLCEIDDPDAPSPPSSDNSDDGGRAPLISGGPTVTINSPSGVWFTYFRSTTEAGEPTYETDNNLPDELIPQGATLSIPGDVFPTVVAHPLYDPTPPVRLLPDSSLPVTADSEFSWLLADGKSRMRLALLAYDENNLFVDFVVGCDVVDDGSFVMPDDVKTFMENTPYRLVVRYTRYYDRIDLVDGIVIRQRNGIAESR